MEKELGKEYSPSQRVQFLKDNCDSVEEKGYMKQFSSDEILEMKENLSETDIQINDLEDEKKEVTKDIKSRLDPLKYVRKGLLKNIKQKAHFQKEPCYKFVDRAEKQVGFYIIQRVILSSCRPLPQTSFRALYSKQGEQEPIINFYKDAKRKITNQPW